MEDDGLSSTISQIRLPNLVNKIRKKSQCSCCGSFSHTKRNCDQKDTQTGQEKQRFSRHRYFLSSAEENVLMAAEDARSHLFERPKTPYRSCKSWSSDPYRRLGQHFPYIHSIKARTKTLEKKRMKKSGTTNKFSRGHCKLCKKVIRYQCLNCNVYLCIEGEKHQSCFCKFHSKEFFFVYE